MYLVYPTGKLDTRHHVAIKTGGPIQLLLIPIKILLVMTENLKLMLISLINVTKYLFIFILQNFSLL